MKTMYKWIADNEITWVDVKEAMAKLAKLDAANKLINADGHHIFFEDLKMWIINRYCALDILDMLQDGLTYEEIMADIEDEYYAMCECDIEDGYYKEFVFYEGEYIDEEEG